MNDNLKQAIQIVDSQIKAFERYSSPNAVVSTVGMIREMKRLKLLLEGVK
jgi:hypothetical protein